MKSRRSRACAVLMAVLLQLCVPAFAQMDWENTEALDAMPIDEVVRAVRSDLSSADEAYLSAARNALAKVRSAQRDELFAEACMGLIRAHYRRSEGTAALQVAEDCAAVPSTRVGISGFVRLRTTVATLLMLEGETDQALGDLRTILDEDLSEVDPEVVRGIQANYASALKLSGDTLMSLSVLSDTLREAIEFGEPLEQVRLGNNLVVMLEELQLFQDAASWIERLQPAIERVPDAFPSQSLRLHDIQLHGILEDRKAAIERFRSYIQAMPKESPVMVGSAYEYLADALFEEREYSQAAAASRAAIALLESSPIERADANLSLARASIALGDFDTAELAIARARETGVQQGESLEAMNALVLRLGLARKGERDLLATLDDMLDRQRSRERVREQQHTRYFDAKLEAAAQATRVEEMEQQQALLQAQAATSAAKAESARQSRNLTYVSATSVVLLFGLLAYLWSQRRFEREFRSRQEALTAELEGEVEVQSQALAKRAHTEALGQLTGNVAHDFNNLLQVMSIANERLATEQLGEASRRLLQGSNEALSSARGIVRRLLAYARQQELDERALGFDSFLEDTRPLLEAALGKSVVLDVVNQVPKEIGISVDKAQLTSALINLLKNSVEAMSGQGSVRMSFASLYFEADDSGPAWDLADGDYVEVQVSDDGHGMSDDQVRRSIEPFFSTRSPSSGTGLGLSSVYGFVRQSGGDVRIASVPGQGTTVALRFPSVNIGMTESLGAAKSSTSLTDKRALVVEDNEVLGEALVSMLEYMDIVPVWVHSGERAIATLSTTEQAFDFVVSDVRMPGDHDGFSLAAWIERNRVDMPVLLISGFSEVDRTSRPLLKKPFTEAELRAALTGLFERPK
ncbi:MAG: ATP-binding protein [Pseudomonadota bacterium]